MAITEKIRYTSLTNFVLKEAFYAVQDTIAEQVQFYLNDSQWHLFCDTLDRPAISIPEIKKLLTEPSVLDEI